MNENEQSPDKKEENTNSIVLDKIVNIDELKDNSVVIFRINHPNESIVSAIKNFVNMYGSKLTEKSCSLLVLGKDAQLEVLNEEEMNKAGWEKKEKSHIIIP